MSDLADTTFVLTSCNRPDLLAKTLTSLRDRTNFNGIAKVVIIEDSDNLEIAEIVPSHIQGVPVQFLQNEKNEGQVYSVERAYGEVETPYVYHCEDDWEFHSSLFLDECRVILQAYLDVSCVLVRDVTTLKYNNYFTEPLDKIGRNGLEGIEFWRPPFDTDFAHGYYSFNPGLRRMEDLAKLSEAKAYASPFDSEKKMSQEFKKLLKMRVAFLKAGDVIHIGWENSAKHKYRAKQKLLREAAQANPMQND